MPASVSQQEKKIRITCGEIRAFSSERMRQGPRFRFLTRPREDVIAEVVKVKKKSSKS